MSPLNDSPAVSALSIGDTAPDFTLPQDDGPPLSLADLRGRPVVLYFYPRDDTSGCTREALDFSALKPDFDALNAVVIGVSKDSLTAHAKFRAKHALTVALASDETGDSLEKYGTWVEKSMYGRRYMGIDRATFLIDKAGLIAGLWRKVKVPGHADMVLKAARALA